jgi:predicted heme/steroid binding protein/uncharacterized membrane protein
MDKDLDASSLSSFDGKDGRPAYVCACGRIVDVSGSRLWMGGMHMRRHAAGKDLTLDLNAAPHGMEVLDRYPLVGTLRPMPAAVRPPSVLWALLARLLARWPLLRRHPHPATVHFPIVFCVCASFFSVLSALTGSRSFDETAYYCLIGAVFFVPLGIITGLATWRINYLARPMRPVSIKKHLSCATVVVVAFLAALRTAVPGLPAAMTALGFVYLALVFALAPAVLIIAYYGGLLTFPVDTGKATS